MEAEKRRHFRHVRTGDRAFLINKGGKPHIQLDRPNEEIVRTFNESEWIEEKSDLPMSRGQVAQVAFDADRALCRFNGWHDKSRREWASLTDQQRIAWMEEGPRETIRQRLWAAILGAMDPYTRQE